MAVLSNNLRKEAICQLKMIALMNLDLSVLHSIERSKSHFCLECLRNDVVQLLKFCNLILEKPMLSRHFSPFQILQTLENKVLNRKLRNGSNLKEIEILLDNQVSTKHLKTPQT